MYGALPESRSRTNCFSSAKFDRYWESSHKSAQLFFLIQTLFSSTYYCGNVTRFDSRKSILILSLNYLIPTILYVCLHNVFDYFQSKLHKFHSSWHCCAHKLNPMTLMLVFLLLGIIILFQTVINTTMYWWREVCKFKSKVSRVSFKNRR